MAPYLFAFLALLLPGDTPDKAPKLGKPGGRVVRVKDERGLQEAVRNLSDNTTILIARGKYRLTNTLHVGGRGKVVNVVLRGETGDPRDVVLLGEGMAKPSENVPHCIMVSNAQEVVIADLSAGEVCHHPVTLQAGAGCKRIRICHCRLFDAGEQFIKGNPGGDGVGVEDGIVEYCTIEYVREGPPNGYTNGLSIHGGRDWTIRHNLFRNIRVPLNAENRNVPTVLMWNGSKNTLCESNTFLNCERAIAFGLSARQGRHDHEGGIIRNNFIYVEKGACPYADAGISAWDSPGTQILHNTVILQGAYPNAIECRFRTANGIRVLNNLTDAGITLRDGAEAEQAGNVVKAAPQMFVDPAKGDLHLQPRVPGAIGKVRPVEDCPGDFDGDERGKVTLPGADHYTKTKRRR